MWILFGAWRGGREDHIGFHEIRAARSSSDSILSSNPGWRLTSKF
jgi:hypothetical protein